MSTIINNINIFEIIKSGLSTAGYTNITPSHQSDDVKEYDNMLFPIYNDEFLERKMAAVIYNNR